MKPFDHHDTPMPIHYFKSKYAISGTTLWRYRNAGLTSISVGKKLFIREFDFIAFLQKMDGQTVNVTPLKSQTKTNP